MKELKKWISSKNNKRCGRPFSVIKMTTLFFTAYLLGTTKGLLK